METPTGTFTINDKIQGIGRINTERGYPYWQQFIAGGWGIHELPETDTWKEPPTHLGTPVSRLRPLGVGPAQAVYDWTSMGTTVYVHK